MAKAVTDAGTGTDTPSTDPLLVDADTPAALGADAGTPLDTIDTPVPLITRVANLATEYAKQGEMAKEAQLSHVAGLLYALRESVQGIEDEVLADVKRLFPSV